VIIQREDRRFGWNLCIPAKDGWGCVASVYDYPAPRIGETIFHEEINGPLIVVDVIWSLTGTGLDCDVRAQGK